MAARKKKKKKAGRKASSLNLVVGSKVKEAIKNTGYRCSGDLVESLNSEVHALLKNAVQHPEAKRHLGTAPKPRFFFRDVRRRLIAQRMGTRR